MSNFNVILKKSSQNCVMTILATCNFKPDTMKKAIWATSRPKNNHHSLQGSKSTNLLVNSSYNIKSNNVEDDDSVLLIGDKNTTIVFFLHYVFIMKILLLNAQVENQGLGPKWRSWEKRHQNLSTRPKL